MLNLFGLEIEITWLGLLGIVLGALVIGVIAQFIGEVTTGYEWVATAVAAFFGGLIASEWLGVLSAWGATWEGVRIFPALIGAVVLGAIVDFVVRRVTGGSYVDEPRPI